MSMDRKLPLAIIFTLLVAPAAFAQYSQMSQPGTWTGGGGGFGGMRSRAGFPAYHRPANLSLVVSQTEQVHGQVADLLEQMRRIQGQQVAIATPFHTVSDDFFERIGVGFGFNINGSNPAGTGSRVVGLLPDGSVNPTGNIQFRQGGVNSALPPFGGHDPASDATAGFGLLGSEGALLFNFFGGQGNNRSHVSQVPRVVIPNGGQGFVSDTSQTPFVTGLIPVVGSAPSLPYYPVSRPSYHYPLHDRIRQYKQQQVDLRKRKETREPLAADEGEAAPAIPDVELKEEDKLALKLIASRGSSAGHGDLSVAEIKRRRAAGEEKKERAATGELLALIERGRGAEAAGKGNVAKIYYRQAASRAEGDLKQDLIAKIKELDGQ